MNNSEVKSTKLFPVQLTKADLLRSTAEEQTFFLIASLYADSLTVLMRQTLICSNHADDDEPTAQASNIAGALFVRHLGGELYEGLQFLLQALPPIYSIYESELTIETKTAWQSIQKYLAKDGNLLVKLRNNVGFHNNKKLIDREYQKLATDFPLTSYLCEQRSNSLFAGSALVSTLVTGQLGGGGDFEQSIETVSKEVIGAVGWFIQIVDECLYRILMKHAPEKLSEAFEGAIIIPAKAIHEMRTDFFVSSDE